MRPGDEMGAGGVRFGLLGPVAAWSAGRPAAVGPARQRFVLAALLVQANRFVPADRIVEQVWGTRRRPEQPLNAVRTYVSLLRTALRELDGAEIQRQPGGYLLAVDEPAVDLHAFHRLLDQARAAADPDREAALLQEALGLWRGEPLAGLDTPWAEALRQSLELRRQAARLDLVDVQLRRGRHAEVLAELTAQAAEHPLDERIAGQLMVALYRSGRQAEALAHYRRVHQALDDELGVRPGQGLRAVQRGILAGEPGLAAGSVSSAAPTLISTSTSTSTSTSAAAAAAAAAAVSTSAATSLAPPPRTPAPTPASPALPTPRQLPTAPRWFVGRTEELARLTALLDERPEASGTPVICAIGGVGGIGKTWLALRWAHRHADRFPDGQLYVNLRGFDPSGRPTPAQTAVRGFLDALGVPPAAVPATADAQVGLYRSLMADRGMLIVLDNAHDSEQVDPLLPGGARNTVLITGRRRLPGLVAKYGACPLELDVLSPYEARRLLADYLGPDRADAEADAVAELLERCAGLPLAISIVAARALAQPALPLALLADELRDASARLDALGTGDLSANVRAALSWSCDALDAETLRVFELLALAPGQDLGVPAAASLSALTPARIRPVLRDLQEAHLLHHHAPGRYRMHDLVRLYAAERADADQGAPDRAAALRRLVDFHVHTAVAAEHLLDPHHPPVVLDAPAAGSHPLSPADESAALAWFEDEHAVLLAVQALAAERGWHAAAWHLAWTLDAFHWRRGHLADDLAAWRAGLAAADALGDPALRVRARRRLGHAHLRAGDPAAGTALLEEGLRLAEQTGDRRNQAHTLGALAWAWELRGDDHQALHHAQRALSIFETLDLPVWTARTLNDVGWHQARLGRHPEARTTCEAALTRIRAHHDRDGEANALGCLAYIAEHTGDHTLAIEYYNRALSLYQDLDHTYEQAATLDRIAAAHAAQGRPAPARHAWHQAAELYRAQHRLPDAERVRGQMAALGTGSDGLV